MLRPCYQFRLRTLFVVVTFAAMASGYMAHEWWIVRKRAEMTDSLKVLAIYQDEVGQYPGLSLRRWFGDRCFRAIVVGASASDEVLSDYVRTFPEAHIIRTAYDDSTLKDPRIGFDPLAE
jgi:hypothetical protein